MWQDGNSQYSASSSHAQYYSQPPAPQGVPLQFYSPGQDPNFFPGSRPSLDGHVGAQGAISPSGVPPSYGGSIQPTGGWWTAFGTGGFEGEPPLLEGERMQTPS
jgi:protein YIPF5/7